MKIKLLLLIFCFSNVIFSQDTQPKTDTISVEKEKKLTLKVDFVSRYLWRGQCWGGDYFAIQPTIEYAITPKLTFGFWGTTNFKEDYFYPDGVSFYKGYQEIDFYISYQINDFLNFQIWDYYWPSVSTVDGVNNGYFYYGKDGVKTVDAILYFDFSEGYKYPFNATISTLVAGNDYRYDSNGDNPKQNFTTYVELGYTFSFFDKSSLKVLRNIELSQIVGAVLNNKAAYYNYADYDQISFCNIGIKITKEIDLGKGIAMPFSLNYIHNAATKNTELFGKNFLIATISLNY
jgi:hypothetical protein